MPRNRDQAENPWSLQEGKLPLLRTAADESARYVQVLYFAFLLLAFYVWVTVYSTTDEQLLKETGIHPTLPNVELPLVEFYSILSPDLRGSLKNPKLNTFHGDAHKSRF